LVFYLLFNVWEKDELLMAKTKSKQIKKKTKTSKTIIVKKSAGKKTTKETTRKTSKKQVTKTRRSKPSPRDEAVMKIRRKLLAQRESLLKEAEAALNTLPGEINFPDMGDQATAETDRNFMLRLRDRERMLLKKIDEAIEGIDKGTFGICEGCGNQIDIKRLEARPVTTLCIECKTKQEEEERIAEGG
jgi:DnaK suppressor protein